VVGVWCLVDGVWLMGDGGWVMVDGVLFASSKYFQNEV
jgi:hypothetical protein